MYIIYGKLKNSKRFQAYDLKRGIPAVNKIHASMINSLEEAEDCVKELMEYNPEYVFEHRKLNKE